jgi:hypothetical protein
MARKRKAKGVTVADLRDEVFSKNPGRKRMLYCPNCGNEYSAHAGDYWDVPADHVQLQALGFDDSEPVHPRGYVVRCSQCNALCINGLPTHEHGCPNFKCDSCGTCMILATKHTEIREVQP